MPKAYSGTKPAGEDLIVGASKVVKLENKNRQVIETLGRFSVLEHTEDASVAPSNALAEYYMREMDVCRKQLIIESTSDSSTVIQAGSMQWMLGDITMTTGIKGAGDLLGKAFRGKATGESTIKPEYMGDGIIVLEPTYKHIILEDVSQWGSGMVIEDGMFLACEGTVIHKVSTRKNISSAVAGGEGIFSMALSGSGVVALESNVPARELIEIELVDDVLKIDGSFAVAWSASLDFTVERAGKSLIGSAASGEGLVNVYRGTGRVLMSPVTPTSSLYAATHS